MRLMYLLAVLTLAVTLLATPGGVDARQPESEPFDLATVPLPVDALPEAGYQVLTGGFLDRDLTAHWIASPRNGNVELVGETLEDAGWISTYVLDLVLLQDRADDASAVLSLVQTNVYLFADGDGAAVGRDLLADFSTTAAAETVEPAVTDAATIQMVSESGDTLRSVVQQERTALEIVTLETAGRVDPDVHRRIVADSMDRLDDLQRGRRGGIASRAVLLEDGDRVADLFNAQQTGVHQLYRVRDEAVQPAAGELDVPEIDGIAPGLVELYQIGQAVHTGSGTSYYSSWIGEFRSDQEAAAFAISVESREGGALLPDPFFTPWARETVSPQGISGVYRVSGTSINGAFSGTLEIRHQGRYVVGIGWRSWGGVMSSVDATSRLMDSQLACLAGTGICSPVPLETLVPEGPPGATPVPPSGEAGDVIASSRFGWVLPYDPVQWTIVEQFAEDDYDFVELLSGESLLTVESVVNQHGDPERCVIEEMRRLEAFEEHAVISLGSDVPDEVPAGLEPGHGWAVYTVEPLEDVRADQEYVIRIDCYTLVEGSVSVVISQRAPRDAWEMERGKGEMIRAALVLPE